VSGFNVLSSSILSLCCKKFGEIKKSANTLTYQGGPPKTALETSFFQFPSPLFETPVCNYFSDFFRPRLVESDVYINIIERSIVELALCLPMTHDNTLAIYFFVRLVIQPAEYNASNLEFSHFVASAPAEKAACIRAFASSSSPDFSRTNNKPHTTSTIMISRPIISQASIVRRSK